MAEPRGWEGRDVRQRLVGVRTKRGKRSRAEAHVEERLRILRHRGLRRPRQGVVRARRRGSPRVESRSKGRKGAVPVHRPPRRRLGWVLRTVVASAWKRKGRRRGERLAREVRSLLVGRGQTQRRRNELHKAALANRTNLRR